MPLNIFSRTDELTLGGFGGLLYKMHELNMRKNIKGLTYTDHYIDMKMRFVVSRILSSEIKQ